MLVTENGTLKLLDFGIAKVLRDTEEAGDAGLTQGASLPLTPGYAAPEQWAGDPVTAATDVYALGVVLYELLCGWRPGWSLAAPHRRPSVEEVEPLGAVLVDSARARAVPAGPMPAEIAATRSTSIRDLRRILTGDLDAIAAQALHPDPLQRYASVRELADDLGRFLAGRPVTSRAASPSYRLRKWLRRHRALVATGLASAAGVAILAALAVLFRSVPSAQPEVPSAKLSIVSDPAHDHDQGSFSPDGTQIAFVRADAAGVAQVWTRPLDRDEPLQRTHGPTAALGPRWAGRDGRLVFYRPRDGIWSDVPPDGPLRQLRSSGVRPDSATDGSRLVFVDQGRIWVARGDGDGAVPLEGVERHSFSWMAEPVLSPDGQTVAFFYPDPLRPLGDLWLAPTAGGAPRQLTRLSFSPGGLAWTPDGRWIVFSSDHGGAQALWRISVDGRTLQPITTGSGEDTGPSVSPDGRRILYTNTRNVYALSRLDPATGDRSTVLERRRPIVLPHLSPQGDRVAFFSRTATGVHLFVQSLEGGPPVQLTRGEGEMNTHPRWDSAGQALFFYQEEPRLGLMRVPVGAGTSEMVVPDWRWGRESRALPSSEGRYLAYTLREQGRIAAGRVRDLETGAEWDLGHPLWVGDWSADGSQVLGGSSESRIRLCPRHGGPCAAVTEGDMPRFGPDGRSIYFVRGATFTEVWRCRLDGSGEERLATLTGSDELNYHWEVLSDGSLLWSELRPGRKELWLATLR
jgi:Tol biopolymer transport system component